MRYFFAYLLLPVVLLADPLRMIVDNHEEEIRSFEERLSNQEAIMESLRNTVQEAGTEQKTQVSHSLTLQEKQLKLLQNKIAELEKKTATQAQQIHLLQDALKVFIDSFQAPETSISTSSSSVKTYTVKNGDSLGKIARIHKTTTLVLRELNQLSGDKIIVGQKLKVPE